MSTKKIFVCLSLAAALTAARADNVPEAAAPCPDGAGTKVAFVFEGAPQAAPAHFAAVQAVSKGLGARACVRTFDHLSTGVDPDANARFLLGSLGLEHYSLVFLLTPRHLEAITKVARQFPETTYLQLDGRSSAGNLIPYRLRAEQAGELAGALAASRSHSGRVAHAFAPRAHRDAAWSGGVLKGLLRSQPDAQLAEVALSPGKDVTASEADVLVVAGASANDLRALGDAGLSLVTWNDRPQGSLPRMHAARLWADWEPFYRAVAECSIARRTLKGPRWNVGVSDGVITGDAGVVSSAAWRNAQRRAGNAAGPCPGKS